MNFSAMATYVASESGVPDDGNDALTFALKEYAQQGQPCTFDVGEHHWVADMHSPLFEDVVTVSGMFTAEEPSLAAYAMVMHGHATAVRWQDDGFFAAYVPLGPDLECRLQEVSKHDASSRLMNVAAAV